MRSIPSASLVAAAALVICGATRATSQSDPARDPFGPGAPGLTAVGGSPGAAPANGQVRPETARDSGRSFSFTYDSIDPQRDAERRSKDAGPRFDFAFDGIPLSEVIQNLRDVYREKTGDPLNVVVPEHLRDMADTSLITMELKQVTAGDLLNVMGLASQREVRRVTSWFPGPANPVPQYGVFKTGYRFERLQLDGSGPAFLLIADLPPDNLETPSTSAQQFPGAGRSDSSKRPAPAEAPGKVVRFFQLDPYLERFSVEDITTSIKAGFELSELKTVPTIRFHEETTLLVVAGEAGHLELVDLALRELGGARMARYGIRPGQAPSPATALPAPRPADPSAKQLLP